MNPLLTILGAAAGPVRELERPFNPAARFRVEARYADAQARYCHRSEEREAEAERVFAAEVAEAEAFGYCCIVRLLESGREVRRVTTEGRC
jgi:hypothetical protein